MKRYTIREVAQILEVTVAQVRTWARLAGIEGGPGEGGEPEFSFQDLLLLKTTRGLLESGVSARRTRDTWSSLRRQVSPGTPLTSISLSADGRRAVASDGTSRWRPESGQFLLDFGDEGGQESSVVTLEDLFAGRGRGRKPAALERRAPAAGATRAPHAAEEDLSAEQWFALACDLEGSAPLEARRAYHRALELEPDFADAHVNLGRHYHECGELGKAEAHYRDAVRCDAADATAHFNLGVLLEDRGRSEEAVHAYEQAIARDPDLADAHYNLGLLLESRHRRADATRHLMIARELYERASRQG
jgi:DNA-binding transcriptional MerR regulator